MFELPVAAARRHKLPTVAASSRNISLTFTPQWCRSADRAALGREA